MGSHWSFQRNLNSLYHNNQLSITLNNNLYILSDCVVTVSRGTMLWHTPILGAFYNYKIECELPLLAKSFTGI